MSSKIESQAEPELRIGSGYDVHQLVKGRPLILGGIKIECELGLAGHSDADVLTHAICDAFLGSCALGDIGDLFPPDDLTWLNADSCQLLATVLEKVEKAGYLPVNIDATVITELPKLAPYRVQIQTRLTEVCKLPSGRVSVKATTAEKLGAIGAGEGIVAYASVLVKRK